MRHGRYRRSLDDKVRSPLAGRPARWELLTYIRLMSGCPDGRCLLPMPKECLAGALVLLAEGATALMDCAFDTLRWRPALTCSDWTDSRYATEGRRVRWNGRRGVCGQ